MKRYNSLSGIRAIACIGILIMHMLANGTYNMSPLITSVIKKCTDFVFLFMILSSFSMCCGYFDKMKNNKISMEDYYKRRISKTLPFFLFLVLINIVVERNKVSLVEGFADFTLMFGFLQKDISVVGVGWFIGLVFIFYLMFPFFVYLFSNKTRGWIASLIALLMNISSIYFFEVGRTNMFYSFIFFCIGGLIFMYKEIIIDTLGKNRGISLLLFVISIILFYIPVQETFLRIGQSIIMSVFAISYAISFDKSFLNTKISNYIGSISLEIYLSHMFIFRILEKIKIVDLIKNDYISFLVTSTLVFIGTILFAKVFELGIITIKRRFKNENIIS